MKVSSGPMRSRPIHSKGLDDVLTNPFGYIARFGSRFMLAPQRTQAEHEELVERVVTRHPDSVREIERDVNELARELRKLKAFSVMLRGHAELQLTAEQGSKVATHEAIAEAKLRLSYLQAILLEVRPASNQRSIDEETWARLNELLSRIFGTFKRAWLSESNLV